MQVLCTEEFSWAHNTITSRIPNDIFQRILEDNYDVIDASMKNDLEDLLCSIKNGRTGSLVDINDGEADNDLWKKILLSLDEHRNWIDAPFIIVECYFYRKLVTIFGWFRTGYDHFSHQKQLGIDSSRRSFEEMCEHVLNLENDVLLFGIMTSLWGNKMDLSLWPGLSGKSDVKNQTGSSHSAPKHLDLFSDRHILRNDSAEVISIMNCQKDTDPSTTVSIVVDNAGFELFCDLILGHTIIIGGFASRVVFHCKKYPTFVSDVLVQDIHHLVGHLIAMPNVFCHQFGKILEGYLESGVFLAIDDFFWCSPQSFCDAPSHIVDWMTSKSSLVFIKGDANYRRSFGDILTPFDENVKNFVNYWKKICLLRILKSEIAHGISIEDQQRAKREDDHWLVSGKWATLTFVDNS